jgi:SAM-dependent methyltransferase
MGYEADLAYVHDVGFGAFSLKAAPGLLRMLRRKRIRSGLVVDLGCGSGIWASELIRAGYDVVGVDLSTSMLKLARAKAPQAKFVRSSLLDFEICPCDAVTSLGECVCYGFDPRNSQRQLRRLCARVFRALRPGGVFIFDVAQPGRVLDSATERYWQGADWVMFRKAEEDTRRHILRRHITVFRQVGKLYRRTEETHELHLYVADQVERELSDAGFVVEILRGYGKLRFDQGLAGFLASKP